MSDSRRRILERRAAFVAAAIASVGAASCQPQVCLSAVADEKPSKPTPPDAAPPTPPPIDAGAEPCLSVVPMPCLSPPPVLIDAGPKPKPDAGKPHPCLKFAPDGDY